jgi:hypothetical protein
LRLGYLIEAILKSRAAVFDNKFSVESQQAELEYEEFIRDYQQQLEDPPQLLDEDEKQQLKVAYRKASRLCHPDKLAEESKARGEEYFKALNEAYRHQDLDRVLRILMELEAETNSLVAVSDKINDSVILQKQIESLRKQIITLEAEVKSLKENEIFQRIQSITDMEGYFSNLEIELKAELKVLMSKKNKKIRK